MKQNVLKLFPLFCLLLLTSQTVHSQCNLPCNDTLQIEPAFDCNTAANSAINGDGPGYVCDLDGFCTNTVDVPPGGNQPFCNASACVLNNPIWFSFIATGPILDVDVCPNKCDGGGGGLQWALYDQCSNLLNPVACWCTPVLPGDVIFNIFANVIPGTTYYLVIDGFSGSTCAIKFRVNSGIEGTPVGELISDVLTGPNPVCKGNTATYSSLGFKQASDYVWTLDGVEIATDVLSVTLDIDNLSLGEHTLCLKGTNDCSHGSWKEKCWTFEVKPKPMEDAMGRICEDSPTGFPFKGSFYQPGTYDVEVPATDGSSCDTTFHLVVEKLLKSEGPEVKLGKCEEHSTIMYQGMSYGTSSPFHEKHYTNFHGCDSLVKIYVYDLAITGDIIAIPSELPCGGGAALLTVNYAINLTAPTYTSSVVWRDKDFNVLAMNTDNITVFLPGTYYAEVTATIDNPDGVEDEVCSKLFLVTITVENSVLVAPNLNRPPFLCAGKTGNFNITSIFPPGTTFEWRASGGGLIGTPNNLDNVDIYWDTPGTYDVCVNGLDACGPGPETCISIQVYPSPRITGFGQDSVCSKDGMLTATLGGIVNQTDPDLNVHWTVVSGPDVPGVLIDQPDKLTTAVHVATNGTYVFRLTVDYKNGGCGESKDFTLIFQDNLILTGIDVPACNAGGQPDPFLIDLDTLITGNFSPFTGTWKLQSGPGTVVINGQNIVDFTGNKDLGVYVFTFTPAKFGLCSPAPISISITLNNCICPTIDINPAGPTVCNDGPTVDLSQQINTGTEPGKWSLTNGPTGQTLNMTNPTSLNFNGQPSGTYLFTYKLNTPLSNCPDEATATVTVVSAPSAVVVTDQTVCNATNALGLPYTLSFDTLVKSGVTTGVWAYTGTGVDPGQGTLPLLNFQGVTPGVYTYSYTIPADAYCKAVTYAVNILVEDCKCPSVAVKKSGQTCSSATSAVIDLTPYKLTTKPGSWSLLSQPTGGSASVTGTTFNGQGSVGGTYVLVFTLDNPSPDPTCPDTSQVIIRLDNAPNAGTPAAKAYCIGDKSSLDLNNQLNGAEPGGVWAYTNSNGSIGSAFNATTGVLDVSQLTLAGQYDFSYTVSSQLGLCPDAQVIVSVTINALPRADAGPAGNITCDVPTVTLDGSGSSTGADYTYEWRRNAAPQVLGTTIQLPGVGDDGTYTLQVTNSKTGCTATASVQVTKDSRVISKVDTAITQISCFNRNDGAFTVSNIVGGTAPYTYSFDGAAPGTQTSYTNLSPGTHTMTIKDANGCPFLLTFKLDNPTLLTVDAGRDRSIKLGDTVNITATVSINPNNVTSFTWTSEPSSPTGSSQTINVAPEITTLYTIVVKDAAGCTATDLMTVSVKSVVRIYIPNVITPNGDGINDVFYIQADRNIKKIRKMTIFNRWGAVQYSASDFPPNDEKYGWNGKFKSKSNDPAVFVYWAELEYADGFIELIKGDVTVVR